MVLALLLAAAVTDVGAVTITPDTVELSGAGSLEFHPDPAAFITDPPLGGDGRSFIVTLWLDPAGRPTTCDPGDAEPAADARTACAQLMASAHLTIVPGMALPLRRGFVAVRFGIFRVAAGQPRQVFAMEMPRFVNTAITYPPDDTPDDRRLLPSDGTVTLPVQPDDYPPIAMRYSFEGRTSVLLGVDRGGRVRSCRPLTRGATPNTAYLDNRTCVLALRRGRFTFAAAAPSFEGLRYVRTGLAWVLPQE